MADGNGNAIQVKNVAPSPIMFGQNEDALMQMDYGPCDVNAKGYKQVLENWRYSTVLIHMVQQGNGDLLVAAKTQVTAFNGGVGDAGSTSGYPGTPLLSDVETDLFPTGGPVKQGSMFRARAIAGQLLRPFAFNQGLTAKRYDPWIDAYSDKVVDALNNNFAMSLQYSDEDCKWKFGVLSFYPQPGGSYGGDVVRTGSGVGIGGIVPTRIPFDVGAQLASDQASILLESSGYDVIVGNNGTVPTEADLFVPFQLQMFGAMKCAPCQGDIIPALIAALQGTDQATQARLLNAMNSK